eukprot:scaffold143704_cov17-Tisochrysis_lutea.AAC.1
MGKCQTAGPPQSLLDSGERRRKTQRGLKAGSFRQSGNLEQHVQATNPLVVQRPGQKCGGEGFAHAGGPMNAEHQGLPGLEII